MTKEVSFRPADGSINNLIDEPYRTKYRGSPYLDAMITRARFATVWVIPVVTHSTGQQTETVTNE